MGRRDPDDPGDAIAPFLTRPYVMDKNQLDSAPYIVDFADEHIMGGAGQKATHARSTTTPT